MSAHCVSVKVMRIKVTSHLATLNHDEVEMGILKRQQSLAGSLDRSDSARCWAGHASSASSAEVAGDRLADSLFSQVFP